MSPTLNSFMRTFLRTPVAKRLLVSGAAVSIAAAGAFIGTREGEVRAVYPDLGGVSTYCFGGTIPSSKAREYTAEECSEQLVQDTQKYWDGVQALSGVDMPWSVHAAMTSAAYNAGLGAFKSSPMLPELKAGRWEAACAALVAPHKTSKGVARGWRATVNLRPVRGLENRRAAEAALCVQDIREGQ